MPNIVSFDDLLHLLVVIGLIWGGVKIAMEIIEAITKRHDREQSWDEAVKKIADEREEFGKQYNTRLDKIENEIKEVRQEQGLIMGTLQAVLDGMIQLKCNGQVTKQKQKVDDYLNNKAHE